MKSLRILFMAFFVAGCSGTTVSTPIGKTAAPGHSDAPAVMVTIRIAVPAPPTSARSTKRRSYVSPATKSVSISVTSDGESVGPFVGNCSGVFCTQEVPAPIGPDDFAVTLYDQVNAAGKVLSSGSASATIAPGANTVVSITFDPVVASASSTEAYGLTAGTPTALPITTSALDPSGAIIAAPGSYETTTGAPATITLSLSDPTGHTTLSGQTTFASPQPANASPAALLTFDGTPPNFAYPVLTTSIDGVASTVSTLEIAPVAVGSPTPIGDSGAELTSATLGPDGNIWFTGYHFDQSLSEIGKFNIATSTTTLYPLQEGAANPTGIVAGGDGDLYFFENGTTSFGQITQAGVIREFSETFTATSLVKGVDGDIWFLANNEIAKIDTSGVVTTYLPAVTAIGIAPGPNNKMWFLTNSNPIQLGSLNADGTSVTMANTTLTGASSLIYAPDGNFYTPYNAVTPAGSTPAHYCAGGDKVGAVFVDGSVMLIGGYQDTSFVAIRPNGTCASGSGDFQYLLVSGPTAGHAYQVFGGIQSFLY